MKRSCSLFLGLLCLVGCSSQPDTTPETDPNANRNAAPPLVDTSKIVPYDFGAVDFLDIARGWIVGADSENNVSVVLQTVNGGATWVVLVEFPGDTLLDVDFVDEQTGWVVGTSGIVYETHDGGKTWSEAPGWVSQRRMDPIRLPARGADNIAPVISESVASIVFRDGRVGWAAGDAPTGEGLAVRGLVLGTTDGGATWAELVDGSGAHAPFSINDLAFTSPNEGWATGGLLENAEEDILLHTVDGGRSWTRVKTGTAQVLRGLHFVDQKTGWVVGMTGGIEGDPGPSKILATTDGGVTWTVQATAPRSFFDVTFANRMRGWAVGDRASVWATTDGGATWRQQTRFEKFGARQMKMKAAAPESRAFRTLCAVDPGTVFAGGEGVILRKGR